jgi:hypothetical protein
MDKKYLLDKIRIKLYFYKNNDTFGELSFFQDTAREVTAKSSDYSLLASIDRNEFIKLLKVKSRNTDDYQKFCMIKDKMNLS